MQQGVWAGVVAVSATLGALVGLGHARRSWLQPVNAIAHQFFGPRALMITGFDPGVTAVGLALHVVAVSIWSIVFVLIAGRLRGWRLIVAAFVFTAIVYTADHWIAPPLLAPGFERVFSTAGTVLVYVTFAVAVAVGARLGAAVNHDA